MECTPDACVLASRQPAFTCLRFLTLYAHTATHKLLPHDSDIRCQGDDEFGVDVRYDGIRRNDYAMAAGFYSKCFASPVSSAS